MEKNRIELQECSETFGCGLFTGVVGMGKHQLAPKLHDSWQFVIQITSRRESRRSRLLLVKMARVAIETLLFSIASEL